MTTKQLTLLPHQIGHFNHVCNILKHHHSYLDTSNMGSGKSYIVFNIAKTFGLSLVVICPLSMIELWESESENYGIQVKKIVTYQSLRGTVKSPPSHGLLERDGDKFKATDSFKQMIKEGILLVFDESHNLKNETAQLSAAHALVNALTKELSSSRVALLSATPCDKPTQAESLLKMLGFIENDKLLTYSLATDTYDYLGIKELINICYHYDPLTTRAMLGYQRIDRNMAYELCYYLFLDILKPKVVSSMPNPKIDFIKDACNGYYNMTIEDLQLLYDGITLLKRSTRFNEKNDSVNLKSGNWADITAALMMIEKSKLNTMVRLAYTTLKENPKAKVILYFNYLDSINKVAEFLSEFNPLVLTGKTTKKERTDFINKFQCPTEEYRLLISNPKVGGVGINLDDRDGNWPRFMYVIPTYSSIDLHQATGRIYRITTKSKATIRFIYSKQLTNETNILNALSRKAEVTKETLYDASDILFPGEYPPFVEL